MTTVVHSSGMCEGFAQVSRCRRSVVLKESYEAEILQDEWNVIVVMKFPSESTGFIQVGSGRFEITRLDLD